jgi:DNA-binding response OmpR family regulator
MRRQPATTNTNTKTPQVFLRKLNLPDEDGLSIATRYKRSNPELYIIMLTACSLGATDMILDQMFTSPNRYRVLI